MCDVGIWFDLWFLNWYSLHFFKFLRHHGTSSLLLIKLLTSQRSLQLGLSWWLWFTHNRRWVPPLQSIQFSFGKLPWTLALFCTLREQYFRIDQGISIDLIEFWLVISTVRVYVVCLEILSIHKSTLGWSSICIAIGVEGGFSKIGGH